MHPSDGALSKREIISWNLQLLAMLAVRLVGSQGLVIDQPLLSRMKYLNNYCSDYRMV